MTTTAHAAAAAAARQRLASVLGTLQQNPNVPPQVLEILSGLARAMGPLFQLERGNTDLSLFQTARGVLQETLAKIQVADQSFPGVAAATEAVAGTLGVIFKAMRDGGTAPAPPAESPMPLVSQPQPVGALLQPAFAPQPARAPQQAPFAPQPVRAPQQPAFAPQAPSVGVGVAQRAPRSPSASARLAAPAVSAHGGAPAGTVPLGPNGVPRLESEIGVHSETNFYTDFLGDIRNKGGIFVATFHVLPLDAQCEISLTFPGNLVAEFRGIVRWKRENAPGESLATSPGIGIEITQADAAAWDLITRFIRKREPIMHEM